MSAAPSMKQPNIRLMIGLNRSASTPLLTALVQHSAIYGAYQPIEMTNGPDHEPNYQIYDGTHPAIQNAPPATETVVFKETLGASDRKACDYAVFPGETDSFTQCHAIEKSRPLFVFREPITQWNSWKRMAASENKTVPLDHFLIAYKHLYKLWQVAKAQAPASVRVLTVETLYSRTQQAFQNICRFWELPYSDQMITSEWKFPFTDALRSFRLWVPTWLKLADGSAWEAELANSTGWKQPDSLRSEPHNTLVTQKETQQIHALLTPLYREAQIAEEALFDLSA